MTRRRFSVSSRPKVALEAIKGHETIAEVAPAADARRILRRLEFRCTPKRAGLRLQRGRRWKSVPCAANV